MNQANVAAKELLKKGEVGDRLHVLEVWLREALVHGQLKEILTVAEEAQVVGVVGKFDLFYVKLSQVFAVLKG